MITIDPLWPTFLKSQDFARLAGYGLAVSKPAGGFHVAWGENVAGARHCVMETGFFRDALHFDAHGLYEGASFNFPVARREIEHFAAPRSWRTLALQPKFAQPSARSSWPGVVVILQHPADRSIKRAGAMEDYHAFVAQACAYYGPRAFLKKHPVTLGNRAEMEFLERVARQHGCELGHVDTSVIDDCEFVLVYNSTFAVDAMMRGKHVMQYAPGYFWQTGCVQYAARDVRAKIATCEGNPDRFLDFLVWRYCVHQKMPLERFAELLGILAGSNVLFPVPPEFSYGAYLAP
jgi:hypothetical protein